MPTKTTVKFGLNHCMFGRKSLPPEEPQDKEEAGMRWRAKEQEEGRCQFKVESNKFFWLHKKAHQTL